MLERAMLVGPFMGELYWEFGRFAPYVIGKKVKSYNNNITMIVMTRLDRLDIYGNYADKVIPLTIEGDNDRYIQDCFKLTDFPDIEYTRILDSFHNQFGDRYSIVENIRPDLSAEQFANKQQFINIANRNYISYEYSPRDANRVMVNSIVKQDARPIIVFAPRFRSNMPRNWKNWDRFYDRVYSDSILKHFNIVICGKSPDYIPDTENRFLDINNLVNNTTSLIGLTVEFIKRAKLTVGSQSAIPNISLLLKTPVLEWGNQKNIHTIDNNIFDTPIRFVEDMHYDSDPMKILHELKYLVEEFMCKDAA